MLGGVGGVGWGGVGWGGVGQSEMGSWGVGDSVSGQALFGRIPVGERWIISGELGAVLGRFTNFGGSRNLHRHLVWCRDARVCLRVCM